MPFKNILIPALVCCALLSGCFGKIASVESDGHGPSTSTGDTKTGDTNESGRSSSPANSPSDVEPALPTCNLLSNPRPQRGSRVPVVFVEGGMAPPARGGVLVPGTYVKVALRAYRHNDNYSTEPNTIYLTSTTYDSVYGEEGNPSYFFRITEQYRLAGKSTMDMRIVCSSRPSDPIGGPFDMHRSYTATEDSIMFRGDDGGEDSWELQYTRIE